MDKNLKQELASGFTEGLMGIVTKMMVQNSQCKSGVAIGYLK